MAMTSSPTIRRRRLGTEMRQLRRARDLTGEQVVARLGWNSNSKLSRIELGQSRPDLADVMDLLDLYEVSGGKREELIAIARDAANTRGWWRSITGMHQRQRGYAELETGAAEIREYTQFLVPGLLQTTEYARTRTHSMRDMYSDVDEDIEAQAREKRQAVLTRDDSPTYDAIIEETALRRHVAPRDVMIRQFHHLAGLAQLPNVTFRVLPSDAQVADFYVPHSAFSIYRFPDPNDPQTVVLETLSSDVHLRDEDEVALYRLAFSWAREAALSPEESAKLVAKLAANT